MDLEAVGADYRAAKAAVVEHLRRQHAAEIAVIDWLRAHRHVPRDALYDPATGEATDPELRDLEAAVDRAVADVRWCRALVVACGEVIKGRPLDEVLAAQGERPDVIALGG